MEGGVVTAAVVAFAAALAAAATQGLVVALAALAAAAGTCVLAVLGRERTATLSMAGAFATAPMYRGILGDLPATPTDLLLVLSVLLLLPEIFSRKVRLPTAFLVALGVLLVFALRGAAVNAVPVTSLLLVAQWMLCIGVLPILIAWWQPSRKVVTLLLWSYLAGHGLSMARAVLEGPLVNNRYDGLTHHSNAFGIAGAVSIAIVFYLWPKARSHWVRAALALAAIASGMSVLMSGSRAATVVVVAIVLLVPIVERSAVVGLLLATLVGLSLAFLPYFVEASGEGSSLSRLVGDGTTEFSDNLREDALSEGQERFGDAPLLGTGLSLDLAEIHNLYLEVLIAVGLLGTAAYAVLLYVLARSLISDHPDRRLAYLVWVFIIIGPAVPALTDRTMLLPMGLAILPAIGLMARDQDEVSDPAPARVVA